MIFQISNYFLSCSGFSVVATKPTEKSVKN